MFKVSKRFGCKKNPDILMKLLIIFNFAFCLVMLNAGFTFAQDGSISGRVTDSTNSGIENVLVGICDSNGFGLYATTTNSNGDYSINVPAGSYKMNFNPPPEMYYFSKWYDNKRGVLGADSVIVVAGQPTVGINAQLEPGGKISGRVMDEYGNGIPNADVHVHNSSDNTGAATVTDSGGYYTLSGSPGNYIVGFHYWASGYYAPQWYSNRNNTSTVDFVVVEANKTTANINAFLLPGGKIAGWVTDPGGNGIPPFPPNPLLSISVHDVNGTQFSWGHPDNNGYYTFNVLPGQWKVWFTPVASSGYLPEWYNNKNSISEADLVSITAGQTTSGINAQLELGDKISGRITGPSGEGVHSVNVVAWDQSGTAAAGALTDSNGNYSLTVAPGNYKVSFTPSPASGNYIAEWYSNKGNMSEANLVSVTAGQTTSGIDAQLELGGRISGRVTDPLGAGVAGAWVNIYSLSNVSINGTETDADGYYTTPAVPAGNYKVGFFAQPDAGNYASVYFNDKSNQAFGDPVIVTEGQTTPNINAQLRSILRLQGSDLSVTDGGLISTFYVLPGFRNLLQSARLTGPNGFLYDFNLQTDTLIWLTECRYLVAWSHSFGTGFNYGEYTLTLNYFDGLTEVYTKNLQPSPVEPVDEQSIGVGVNDDGSANVTWELPSGQEGKYYQVRVRSSDGITELFNATVNLADQNSVDITSYSLRCLEQNQSYRWLVRAYDALPSNYNWGVNLYQETEISYRLSDYTTLLSGQRITSFSVFSPAGKLAIYFDVRPASRDDIVRATVTGPNNFTYTFDRTADYFDISTENVWNKGWLKVFDPPIAFGNYTLEVEFADGRINSQTKSIQDVPVLPVNSGTMNSNVGKNGSILFGWELPSGASNQRYQVKVRNVAGTKEYYSSANNIVQNSVTAYFWDLRNLEHCKTYQWFVRAFDPGYNSRWDSNQKTFFYNPFSLNFHTLTVAKSGSGAGTITSSPAGINCGSYCSDTFVAGLPVTLTATPNSGSIFAGWSGGCSGTGACTVSMTSEVSVTANFIVDADGDGIDDQVDEQPTVPSNDFRNNATYGTITNRGNQNLTVLDVPSPDGVKIIASPSGGSNPATVSVCGSSNLNLTAGDEVVVTCGSVTVKVLQGTVGVTFISTDGSTATASLNQGNTLEFEPTTVTFTAPSSNPEPAVVLVGNTHYSIGAGQSVVLGALSGTAPVATWIGLKNSDDQGTQFDLRAELYINDRLVSSGQTLCITGVTRNPSNAKGVSVPFGSVSNGVFNPGEVLSVRLLTRIGTNPNGTKCSGPGGSHNNAVGLRLYFDSPDRPSKFGAKISQNPVADLFLHSSGSSYFLDGVSPSGAAKYKDSPGINFKNGNPWKEIGVWRRGLQ